VEHTNVVEFRNFYQLHAIMQLKMKPIISCEAHACMKYFVPQSTTQFANGEIIVRNF
jgi:hypothetical protein